MSQLIALDFGHGGKDSGATGNGLKEKEVVLEIGLQVKQRLLEHDFEVTCLREDDSYVGDAGERGAILGQTQADYALSIHLNSSSNITATGAEIIVPCKESYANVEYHMKEELEKLGNFRRIFSRKYSDGVTVERQINSNGRFTSTVDSKDYYGIIREAWAKGVSATIVELFFISNASDCENYKKQKEDYVEAIVKSICKGFNVKYKTTEDKEASSNETDKVQNKEDGSTLYYRVVVNSYSNRNNAITQQEKLNAKGFDSFLVAFKKDGVIYYRVVSGSYTLKSKAEEQQAKLKAEGFDSFLATEWIAMPYTGKRLNSLAR